MLANQLSEVCNPEDYWWGLTHFVRLRDLDKVEEQKLYLDFSKAQYSILHVLSENFGTYEKQIISDHDTVVLVEKYIIQKEVLRTVGFKA
jgi:hypothetical protein